MRDGNGGREAVASGSLPSLDLYGNAITPEVES